MRWKQPQDALEASEQMIRMQPKNPLGYRRKGTVLRAMGKFKESCMVFKIASKVSKEEEKKIAEGILEIDDPIEKEDTQEKNNLEEEKKKKDEKKFKFKRYKIQEVIKPNQVILVQVIKDERGQKGAALSTFISIAGKYIVLMPNTPKGGGISRKIFNPADRKKN